jgi:hypothetical protein
VLKSLRIAPRRRTILRIGKRGGVLRGSTPLITLLEGSKLYYKAVKVIGVLKAKAKIN